jgi:hypothetical protein
MEISFYVLAKYRVVIKWEGEAIKNEKNVRTQTN